ncbi:MAG TPA: DNA polymerase III subunit delta [Candidatus Hydrogenedens sp.]|nr:DNA polymerase III subunit delta [Candidatus Hydrogenedens sp.]HOK10522.1 DNA polymerase III subunit delta [Candidatus Hydrogenedens sp.]HPP59962.1 DNA polymerase III subunit delta [Candidatus Hydrogenedens sp.]
MDIKQFKKSLDKGDIVSKCLLFCPSVSGNNISFEPVLAEEMVEQLTARFIPSGEESFGIRTFYGDETSIDEVLMECKTLPFFSSKKVVIVRKFEVLDRSEKSEAKSIQSMVEYLENPSETTLLLCIAESTDARKPLYKTFTKINGIIECPLLSPNELRDWIKKYLAERKKKISLEALEELMARCGAQLKDIQNELTLLVGFVGDRETITIKDVLASCADVAEESVWHLTDAIARGDMKNAWLILKELIQQGKEPPEIIGVIQWLLENAYRTLAISEEQPKSTFVRNKVTPLAQRFGLKKLVTAMNLCNETTYTMRQTGMDEKIALELLVLKLSYVPEKHRNIK